MYLRHCSSQVSNVSGVSVYTDGKYFQFNHFESLDYRRAGGLVTWTTKFFCCCCFLLSTWSSVSNCTKHWFHWPVCWHYRGLFSCTTQTYAEQPLIFFFFLRSLFYRIGHWQHVLLQSLYKIYIITLYLKITCSYPLVYIIFCQSLGVCWFFPKPVLEVLGFMCRSTMKTSYQWIILLGTLFSLLLGHAVEHSLLWRELCTCFKQRTEPLV